MRFIFSVITFLLFTSLTVSPAFAINLSVSPSQIINEGETVQLRVTDCLASQVNFQYTFGGTADQKLITSATPDSGTAEIPFTPPNSGRYIIFAYCGGPAGETQSDNRGIIVRSTQETTAAPTNVRATPGANGIVVSWDPVPHADRYEVFYRHVDVSTFQSRSTENTVIGIGGLQPDTQYFVQVRACNSAGCFDQYSQANTSETKTLASASALRACSRANQTCNPTDSSSCQVAGENCSAYSCKFLAAGSGGEVYTCQSTTPPPEGTCSFLPGPPLRAVNNCKKPGFTPSKVGSDLLPKCVCNPTGDPTNLPDALIENPPTPTPIKNKLIDCKGDPDCERCIGSDVSPKGIPTALGCLATNPAQFIGSLFGIFLSLAGGIALLLIIYSGYRMVTSTGNPEALQGARETLTAAIVGLLFVIFSFVILEIIGVDILRLPQFTGRPAVVAPKCLDLKERVANDAECGRDRAKALCDDYRRRSESETFTGVDREIWDLCIQKGYIR